MKIVVLKGGISSEREISLISGSIIAKSLRNNGHNVVELDTVLPIEQLHKKIEVTDDFIKNGNRNLISLLQHSSLQNNDFIFNALHGGEGENGEVQSLLQMFDFKTNGSDSTGCAIAMDKVSSKLIFERYKIPTPKWEHFNRGKNETIAEMVEDVVKNLKFPVVVKPSSEGSTVGLSIVEKAGDLEQAFQLSLKYCKEILVEEFIPGRELTVSILNDEALPILEIIPKHRIYDYECKYADGMSEYRCPADLDEQLAAKIKELSVIGFRALKCSGYGRMDLRLSEDNDPYFLELNTLPGMTSHSLLPKAALTANINFETLLEKIIETGLKK
jgi:D-alanine-D-alanine ligase